MEINDLRTIWKKADDENRAGYWVSQEDLQHMIRKKSHAAITNARKELLTKIRMTSIIGPLALLIGLANLIFPDNEGFIAENLLNDRIYGSMMVLMSLCIIGISIHARMRYRQIGQLERSADSLKTALTRTKEIFGKIITTGILSDTIVTPIVMVCLAGAKVYQKVPLALDIRLFYLLITGIVFAFIFNRLSRFLMNRKFGRFVKALDDRLVELKSLESEISEGEL